MRFKVLLPLLAFTSLVADTFAACISPAWVATYDGPYDVGIMPSQDYVFAVATDRFGNVLVTGYGYATLYYPDMLTVKYDAAGRELWVRAYSFSERSYDYGAAIAVDDDGNVYVTGDSDSLETGHDIATVKYDPDGNQLWVARYDGSIHSSDTPNAIALDKNGSVYVAGYSYGSDRNFDAVTIKYDGQGNELWVARYDGAFHREDRANALALDEQGNAYITGMETVGCYLEPNGDEVCEFDIVTIKYDTEGHQLWVARFDDDGGLYDTAWAIAVDPHGQVYVAGQSGNPGAISVTLKYSALGELRWARREPGDYPGNMAIAVDTRGMVYTSGLFAPLRKYDPFGRRLWQGPAGHLLKLDSQDNVYVGASPRTASPDADFLVTRLDPSGNVIWCGSYDSGSGNRDDVRALALDRQGNVFLTGLSVEGTNGNWNYKTVKFVQPELPELSTVGIMATDPLAYEAPRHFSRNATFHVGRKGETNEALTVSYSIGGTAANGVDYQTLSGQVTIPAGSYTARIIVQPIDDLSREGPETVRLRLNSTGTYLLSLHREAAAVIVDDERWWWFPSR